MSSEFKKFFTDDLTHADVLNEKVTDPGNKLWNMFLVFAHSLLTSDESYFEEAEEHEESAEDFVYTGTSLAYLIELLLTTTQRTGGNFRSYYNELDDKLDLEFKGKDGIQYSKMYENDADFEGTFQYVEFEV